MEMYKVVMLVKILFRWFVWICLKQSSRCLPPKKPNQTKQKQKRWNLLSVSHLQRYSGFLVMCASGTLTWLILTKLANILWVLIREPLFHWGQLRDSKSGCCSLLFTWACLNGLKKYTLYIIKKRQSRRLLNKLSMYTPLLKITEYFKCNLLGHQVRKVSVSEVLFLRFVFLT